MIYPPSHFGDFGDESDLRPHADDGACALHGERQQADAGGTPQDDLLQL